MLDFLTTSLKVIEESSIFAEVHGYLSPSIITGDNLRPELQLKTKEHCLYVLELTIGFETNLYCNADRKRSKYAFLIYDLKGRYKSVTFVNLSISSLGIFSNSCFSFLDMCDSLSSDEEHKRYFISKVSTISIRTTYYIFCCRNKPSTNTELLPF